MTRAADKRGSYWRGKARPENRRPTTAASTAVRQLFEAVDAAAMTYKTLATVAGPTELLMQDASAPFMLADMDKTMTRVIMPMRV